MYYGNKITLVIPCRNEEKALAVIFKKIPSLVDEIIVVDNNSSDNTRNVALELGARVIKETRKDHRGIGYGYAHQAGIASSKGDIIVTMDGDGTYPAHQIKDIVRFLIKSDKDFVVGSRFPLIDNSVISTTRKFGITILNLLVRLLYGYPIKDTLSGMWAIKKSTAIKLRLSEGGWNLSPEIKLKALAHSQVKFSEYHIDHAYRAGGDSKQQIWITGTDHFFYVIQLRIRLFRDELKVQAEKSKKNVIKTMRFFPATTVE